MPLFDYNHDLKVITIPSPTISVTCQELVNDIREEERDLASLNRRRIAVAEGKRDIGGGVSIFITIVLVNGWRLAFAARPGPTYVNCTVTGGTIIGEDVFGVVRIPGGTVISPTAFTQVVIAQSASTTAVSSDGGLTTASIADAVWDEVLSGHVTPGTVGFALHLLKQMVAGNVTVNPDGTLITVFEEDASTPLATYSVDVSQRIQQKVT